MLFRRNSLTLYFAITLIFISCIKKDIIVALQQGKDCQTIYQNEKKIKTIVSKIPKGPTNTFDFLYKNSVISQININTVSTSASNYVLFYASGVCLASGFTFKQQNPYMDLNGAFTIDNINIIERILTPEYRDPYNGSFTSNHDKYIYDSSNKIVLNTSGFAGSFGSDEAIHIGYRHDGNVDGISKFDGNQDLIVTKKIDSKNNPFKQQNSLFYVMKFLPLSSFPKAIDDVWHYFSLNVNNPLELEYSNSSVKYHNTFEYTYTTDGYPIHINIYHIDYPYGFNYPPSPKFLQEEVTIQYL
jgi:hypothetical protein